MPYLLLFMQIGDEKAKLKSMKPTGSNQEIDKYRAVIYSQSISNEIFPNMSENMVTSLKNFALASKKLFKSNVENQKVYDTITDCLNI